MKGKKNSGKLKLVMFDFDGTLADSMSTTIEVFNGLSSKYGYRKITRKDVHAIRNSEPMEALSVLGISIFKMPLIIRDVRSRERDRVGKLRTTVKIKPVLERLKRDGIRLGVVTTNSKENVKKFVKSNKIDFFDHIFSGTSLLGKSDIIRKALKSFGVRPDEAVYVVDEVRDIWAAKESGVKVIAVSWGYNSERALRRERPDFLARRPGDIAKFVGRI